MAAIQTEENRTVRKRVLDAYMRNLTPEMRRAMKMLGISRAEYRRRLEEQLFGPLVTATDHTEVISPTSQPVTWKPWPEVQAWTGSVTLTCPVYPGMYITNQ